NRGPGVVSWGVIGAGRRPTGRPPPTALPLPDSTRCAMPVSPRRAVLTGIGVVNPVGSDPASFWDSLDRGRSGVRTIRQFDPSGLPVRFAGEVPDFDVKKYIDKKDRRSLRV